MATNYYSDMVDEKTACYRLYDRSGRLLYAGISMRLGDRMSAHRRRLWWRRVARIRIEWFAGREAAKRAEAIAIRDERALHNIVQPRPEGV